MQLTFLERRFGSDLALCVYMKRLRSTCRCDVSTLAESWMIMHSCAYMRPSGTPSIRQNRMHRVAAGVGSYGGAGPREVDARYLWGTWEVEQCHQFGARSPLAGCDRA